MKKYLLMATASVVFFACAKKADDKKAEGAEGDKKEAAPKPKPTATKDVVLESLKLEGYKKGSVTNNDNYASVYFTDKEKSPEGYSVNISINVNPCDKLIKCEISDEAIKKLGEPADKNEKREVAEIVVDGKKVYLVHMIRFDGTPKGNTNWAKIVYPNDRFLLSINLKGEGFATTSEAELAKMGISHYKEVATKLVTQLAPQI